MANKRPGPGVRDTASSPDENWPHLLSVGSMVGAVLFVLVLGAILRSDPGAQATETMAVDTGTPHPGSPARSDVPVEPAPDRQEPTRAVSPPPVLSSGQDLDRLADRAERDLERISSSANPWTSQLALLCDPERARQIVERFGNLEPLHVLPTFHDGQSCFLVCWNTYPSRDRAKAARDLPAGLRAIQPDPLPKQITQVLE